MQSCIWYLAEKVWEFFKAWNTLKTYFLLQCALVCYLYLFLCGNENYRLL